MCGLMCFPTCLADPGLNRTQIARIGGANFVGSAEMQIMDALKEAAEHLAEFEAELNGLGSGPFVVEGVTGNYVAKLLARIRATYTAMSDLVEAGHHDQMVVLFRRQLEDSMRLHYLAAHTEQSDALILGHQRMRDLKVRRRLDRVINNPETPSSMLPDLKMMVAKRRARIEEIDSVACDLGITDSGVSRIRVHGCRAGAGKGYHSIRFGIGGLSLSRFSCDDWLRKLK